jgi:S1-C subfamily serine protease
MNFWTTGGSDGLEVSVISVFSLHTEITVIAGGLSSVFLRGPFGMVASDFSASATARSRVSAHLSFFRTSLPFTQAHEFVTVRRDNPGRAMLQKRQIGRQAFVAACGLAIALRLAAAAPAQEPAAKTTEDPASAALAPVVYNDDETAGAKGFQYTFFGNAFFINEDGYLLTVAHVLESFSNGGQPYILLGRENAPPQLVKVEVVAKDAQHDVAILRATPNPFAANHTVSFVALSSSQAARGETVLALSLHPKRAQNAHTFELQREDFSPGTVIAFESTQLAKAGPPADVFLLSHPVVKGQSGSPVLDAATHSAVGLIEGIWLRGTSASIRTTATSDASAPGAAIPMRYALALLKENGVTWHDSAPVNSSPNSSLSSSGSH